jgi:hypothetical protein
MPPDQAADHGADIPHTDDGADLEVADPADFFVTREDGDHPGPVTQRIPGTEQALRVRPLTNAQLESWGDELEADDPADATIAKAFNYALVDFDGEITERMVREGAIGYSVMPILQAIKNASNYQAFLGFREQRMQMARMLENIDPEQLDTLLNLADRNEMPSGDIS